MSPVLETDRLILRALAPRDRDAFIRLSGDEEVMRYLGGTMSPAAAAALFEAIADHYQTHGLGKVAVERKTDGAFLGLCGLSVERWYPDDLEVGWRLLPEHWGQGYATEAAAAWCAHAFETLGAARLISIADVPNTRSHRVMARLGLRYDHTATLRDGDVDFAAHVYVLGIEGWRARR